MKKSTPGPVLFPGVEPEPDGTLPFQHFEDCLQLGYGEQLLNSFCQVQELQLATGIADGRVRVHQFTDTGAVNLADVGKVYNDVLCAALENGANRIGKYRKVDTLTLSRSFGITAISGDRE